MAETRHIGPPASPPADPGQHPERHQHYHVNVRILVMVVAIFLVAALLIHLFLYWLFGAFDRRQGGEIQRQPLTGVDSPPQVPPPGVPRIRAIPGYSAQSDRAAMSELNEHNERILRSYGPTTRPGTVHIPVNRAIDLMLERGMLPVRVPAARPSSTTPGDAPHGSP